MWIKVRTILAGPEHSAKPGQVIEVADVMGKVLVEAGYAEKSGPPQRVVSQLSADEIEKLRGLIGNETATAPDDSEKALVPHGKGKK